MEYKAPNGHIIHSKPYPEIVTYSCPCSNMADGVYESEETTGAGNAIGIKQIKITRTVYNGQMTISIREASEQELEAYKQSLITTNTE